MAWRNSALWMTGGMMASVGFVWAGHLLKKRPWARGERREGREEREERQGGDEKLERRARLEAQADEIVREEQLALQGAAWPGAEARAVAGMMPMGVPPLGSERPFSSGEPPAREEPLGGGWSASVEPAPGPSHRASSFDPTPEEEPLSAPPSTAKGLFSLPVGTVPPIVREARDLDIAAQEDAARDDAIHDIFAAETAPREEAARRRDDVAGSFGGYDDPQIEVGERAYMDIDIDLGSDRTSGIETTFNMDDLSIEDTRRDPTSMEWPEAGETARANQHFAPVEEPYDAMAPEDVGAEWLNRATESAPIEGRDPVDALEGTEVMDLGSDDTSMVSERNFGADQEGEPMAPYAGASEEDVASRLPVGKVDERGNVGLHTPDMPPDAFEAPPTSELSPTQEELARREAAQEASRRKKR